MLHRNNKQSLPLATLCIVVMKQDEVAGNNKASVRTKLKQKVLALREHCSEQEKWINCKTADGEVTTVLELFIH